MRGEREEGKEEERWEGGRGRGGREGGREEERWEGGREGESEGENH